MKLLSADDMREFINQKKTNNSRRIKEALTIKDLESEVSPGSEAIQRLCLFKKSIDSRCDKKKIYNEEEGGKIGLEQAKRKSNEFVERGVSRI